MMETLIACKICGLVQRVEEELASVAVAECDRCGSTLTKHKVNSLGRTAAFSLAALIFYVPANIYLICISSCTVCIPRAPFGMAA
jgi:paraquat-inducible protein A